MSRRFLECHVLHHIARLHNLLKSLHNSSPISLASPCRLPPTPHPSAPRVIPAEDRCGSKVLWDPDGTFLTIRFGLPLENDPLPVCDTNVSSSARNERTPPNEILKKNTLSPGPSITISFLGFFSFLVWMKRQCFAFVCL